MGLPEEKQKYREQKKVFEEIMAENYPTMMKNIILHMQEAPSSIHAEMWIRHIIVKNAESQRQGESL